MNVDYESIDELFRVEDIEGLIAAGAPADEYQPEVDLIFAALQKLPANEATEARLIKIFDEVWMFGHSEEETGRRQPAFEAIAKKIIHFFA